MLDGDGNKENIAPLNLTPVNSPQNFLSSSSSSPGLMTSRAARALRRSTTEILVTPTRARTIKRTASFSTSFSSLSIATPPPTPLNLLPFHGRVRALLRANGNETASMPGREPERQNISEFITTFMSRSDVKTFHSLYISGSPGSGKTALMNEILGSLSTELKQVKVVNINCMALRNIEALWDRLVDEFEGVLQKKRKLASTRKARGREAVDLILSEMSTQCLLVLDELDHIVSNTQSICSILNLAKSDKLCIVGIANTHTLSTSSAQFQTLHFSPYTSAQLLQILESRLSALSSATDADAATRKRFLPLSTLTLLTKKIAALTGDVRTLFEVLRGAIDLAVSTATTKTDDNSFFAQTVPTCSVAPAHVLAALKTSTSSGRSSSASSSFTAPTQSTLNGEIVTKVTGLGLQARLVLLAVLLAIKRIEAGLGIEPTSSRYLPPLKSDSTTPGVNGTHLHTHYCCILRRGEEGVSTPVSRNEFSDLLGMLEGVGLIALTSSDSSPRKKRVCFRRSASFGKSNGAGAMSGGLMEEVRLAPGVWRDEVLRGLGIRSTLNAGERIRDVKEEELNAIWMGEDAVLRKEVKVADAKKNVHNRDKTFVDALLDE
ncbi:P-loop containing nucleoside triphosphate hydrolase protein [Rhodocollybia butyracea]|uniref:P-loop containing nucleoside triphosphate hydrolase protein n=1 Tax=Rhodocollybia butyracea TaxID=206335 RepID=A0A9P5PGQ0_9AGAR|nr:P-loop containing nucleoside triphosphate hydrolase protein [Rhodocollybia butyracea]